MGCQKMFLWSKLLMIFFFSEVFVYTIKKRHIYLDSNMIRKHYNKIELFDRIVYLLTYSNSDSKDTPKVEINFDLLL